MTKKIKKYTLALSGLAVGAAPIASVVACGSSNGGDTGHAYKYDKTILKYYSSSKTGNNPYAIDRGQFFNVYGNYISGAVFSREINSLQVGLVQEHHEGLPVYNNRGNLVSGSKIKAFYTLELASQIKLTFADGTTKVYDKDDHGSSPSAQSINNASFKSDLEKTTKIEFKVRNDAKYIGMDGQVNGTVKVADFWNKIKSIELASTPSYRYANGGSKSLDNEADAKIKTQFGTANAGKPLAFKSMLTPFGIKNKDWFDINDAHKSSLIDESANSLKFEFNKASFLTNTFFKNIIARSS